jgi:hypothetical protein
MSPRMKIQMKYGAQMVIYPRDHKPAHVHIISGNAVAKITLDGEVLSVEGFTYRQVKEFVALVLDNRELLEGKWNEIQKNQI